MLDVCLLAFIAFTAGRFGLLVAQEILNCVRMDLD